MNTDDIHLKVSRWLEVGSPLSTDQESLKDAYHELVGDSGSRCRTCPNFWSDVLHTLRVHLKSLGYQAMKNNQKYMISPSAGYIQVHGLPYAYINKGQGVESESAKHLTDEIAEQLLKENPDRASVIVDNPEYEPESGNEKSTASKASFKPASKAKSTKAKIEKPVTEPSKPTVLLSDPGAIPSESNPDLTPVINS